MKTLIVYYSNKGSNRYLAQKIAQSLACEIEEIKPRLDVFFLFLMNIHMGIRPLKHSITAYDQVILCGPIWMGKLIPPLKSFIRRYQGDIKKMIFVSCCGSTFAKKDEKFGHGLVFREVEQMLEGKCILCEAFPIGLVLPDDQKEDADAFMKTHLNDGNFKGEILVHYNNFIQKVAEN